MSDASLLTNASISLGLKQIYQENSTRSYASVTKEITILGKNENAAELNGWYMYMARKL